MEPQTLHKNQEMMTENCLQTMPQTDTANSSNADLLKYVCRLEARMEKLFDIISGDMRELRSITELSFEIRSSRTLNENISLKEEISHLNEKIKNQSCLISDLDTKLKELNNERSSLLTVIRVLQVENQNFPHYQRQQQMANLHANINHPPQSQQSQHVAPSAHINQTDQRSTEWNYAYDNTLDQRLIYQTEQQQRHHQNSYNETHQSQQQSYQPKPQQKHQLLPQHIYQRQHLVAHLHDNTHHPPQSQYVGPSVQPQINQEITERNHAYSNTFDHQPRPQWEQAEQQYISSNNDTHQLQQQSHQPHHDQQQPPQQKQDHQQRPYNDTSLPKQHHHRPKKHAGEDLTIILGDSLTRGINTRNIRRSTSKNVIIRTFPGATVKDMVDYIKPSLRLQPAHIIIHVGTNDLKSSEVKTLSENISKLCDEIYNFNPKIDITLSQIITRTDSPGINEKVAQLNNLLKGLCEARNLGIISHENIDERGLDRFGLHLNRSGSGIMARNLINCIQHL